MKQQEAKSLEAILGLYVQKPSHLVIRWGKTTINRILSYSSPCSFVTNIALDGRPLRPLQHRVEEMEVQGSPLPDPRCFNMQELPSAAQERTKVSEILQSLKEGHTLSEEDGRMISSPSFIHLSRGLALTTGSALGSIPPSVDECLAAFIVPNSAGLTTGARAWTKHAHRSQEIHPSKVSKKEKGAPGWWGYAQGPKAVLNEKAVALFWRIVNVASWRNLHWLPHQVLVYEMRVPEGYGMRWSQDQSVQEGESELAVMRPWVFRGFVEPMIENGHEIGWRNPVAPSPGVPPAT